MLQLADFKVWLCVLSAEQLPAIVYDSLGGLWLTQPQSFITKRTIITLLNPHLFDKDWFVANYVEKHMQMHHGSSKKAALAHLSRHIQPVSAHSLPQVKQNGSLYLHDDIVVTADDVQIKTCLEQQCSKDMNNFHAGHLSGFVFEFGQERLGAIFVRFDAERRALCLHHPFLRRDLLCSTYTLQLIGALLKSPIYANLGLEHVEVAVPFHLFKYFEPVLEAARATAMQNRMEVARFYGGEPRYAVGYSCSVSNVLRLLHAQ